jgi:hypothetical protein
MVFRGILAARTRAFTVLLKNGRMYCDSFDGPWEALAREVRDWYDETATLAFEAGRTMAAMPTETRPPLLPSDGRSAFKCRCECGTEHSEFFCPHCGVIAQ